MKIGVGSVVKAEIEENTRERRITNMWKEVTGRVQAVVGKQRFLVQFEDGYKKEISSSLLVFLCSKEEVGMDEPL